MFSLKSRQDQWRLLFPKEFLTDEIQEKYTKVLRSKRSFYTSPFDFLNETIQSIQVLGFQNATIQQQQTARGTSPNPDRKWQNNFLHTSGDYNYRSEVNPIHLVDKTSNVSFRHTLGFLNYFMIFENFFNLYARDTSSQSLLRYLFVDIPDENGRIYCRLCLHDPVIDTMDMLDLNYTQPISNSQTFQVQFKYSNISFEFILDEEENNENNS
jgi:hypothetical protein